MRAVKAKFLRRMAEIQTQGKPARQLLGKARQVVVHGQTYQILQAVNDPQSTRGVYRAMKKNQTTGA